MARLFVLKSVAYGAHGGGAMAGLFIFNYCRVWRKVITESSIRVAYGAHGGGAMAGLFIGLIVLENRRVHHYEVTGSRKKKRKYITERFIILHHYERLFSFLFFDWGSWIWIYDV